MKTRRIEFIGDISTGHVDLFIKLIHNLCKSNGLKKLYISSNDVTMSLLNDHVEAIGNEAITYLELENSVRNTIK
jgi:hypothetical protein